MLASCKQQNPDKPTVGNIMMLDDELLTIIDTSTDIEILAEGFVWSEGPLWLESEAKVIFSDVPQNTIYSWDEKQGKQVYLHPAGFTGNSETGKEEGSNGLMLDTEGHLLICQHGNRAIAKMMSALATPQDSFTFLATHFDNKKLNSPNDLCVAKDGTIFFTDPPYGLPDQDSDIRKELSFNGVYQLSKEGNVTLIDSTMSRPNGIALSSDEKYMYVANSDKDQAIWVKYALDGQKKVVAKTTFADKTLLVPDHKGLPDGMKINAQGYLFFTGPGGVLIFHRDGRHLGTIHTGQATSNCAFDTDQKYLYMTADGYLMRVRMKSA
ncbi:MAG: SMP-30/gluconolactonase/LRE family protein [Saprospiraceae bacterium]